MSVLIKGLKMPKDDFIKIILYPNGLAVKTNAVDYEEFEAVPILPHGRLIDADKAYKQGWTISRTYSATPTEMIYEVKKMTDEVLPTIIEAEE